jgi:peptide deformylase
MAYLRPIVKEGDPVLRRVAKKVSPSDLLDPLFQQLVDEMFETMYAAPGVGLAAPQVNVSKRLFVVDAGEDAEHPEGTKHVVINPKIESAHEEVELHEGCLSVPGFIGDIVRYDRVVVTGLDRNGQKLRLEGSDLFAQALQHEIDHLNGVLYIDTAKNIRKPKPKDENEEEDM